MCSQTFQNDSLCVARSKKKTRKKNNWTTFGKEGLIGLGLVSGFFVVFLTSRSNIAVSLLALSHQRT